MLEEFITTVLCQTSRAVLDFHTNNSPKIWKQVDLITPNK